MDEPFWVGSPVRLIGKFLTLKTTGSMNVGFPQLSVRDPLGYNASDPVYVEGAGAIDGDLWTTIASVSGSVLTLAAPALSTVIRGEVARRVTPDVVTCTVRDPDGVDLSCVTQVITIGVYEAAYVPAQEGRYTWEMVGTGANPGRADGEFTAEPREAP